MGQGQTDELLTWLSKVQQKKATIRTTRARDFRKEALLEAARVSAQTELEKKQRERLQRWREVRPTICRPPSPPLVERDENLCTASPASSASATARPCTASATATSSSPRVPCSWTSALQSWPARPLQGTSRCPRRQIISSPHSAPSGA